MKAHQQDLKDLQSIPGSLENLAT